MNLTLYKCILHEIWPNFLASLFVVVLITGATKMLSITELIVNRGLHTLQATRMLLYLLPDIMMFALPVATLLAVVVAFLRLAADSEILALKSSGISAYQMLPPVILVSFLTVVSQTEKMDKDPLMCLNDDLSLSEEQLAQIKPVWEKAMADIKALKSAATEEKPIDKDVESSNHRPENGRHPGKTRIRYVSGSDC